MEQPTIHHFLAAQSHLNTILQAALPTVKEAITQFRDQERVFPDECHQYCESLRQMQEAFQGLEQQFALSGHLIPFRTPLPSYRISLRSFQKAIDTLLVDIEFYSVIAQEKTRQTIAQKQTVRKHLETLMQDVEHFVQQLSQEPSAAASLPSLPPSQATSPSTTSLFSGDVTPLFCDDCGAANKPTARFCRVCGKAIASVETHPLSSQTSTTSMLPNQSLLHGRYSILRPLGQGGMGRVYLAADTRLGSRLVAIKEMLIVGLSPQEQAEATAAFQREALLLAGLTHPNLPRIYEQFTEAGRSHLVMDFIEGETLEAYLAVLCELGKGGGRLKETEGNR